MSKKISSLYDLVVQLKQLKDVSEIRSLSAANRATRVTPTAIVDKDIAQLPAEVNKSLMQTLLDIFTGEYLAAIGNLTKVGDVSVISILEQFSTSRDPLADPGMLRKLPSFESLEELNEVMLAMEAGDVRPIDLSKLDNLAVGKQLSVPISDGKKSMTANVTVRMLPQIMDIAEIVPYAAKGNVDDSFVGRWRRFRYGELSLIDYVTARDVIKQERKAALNDNALNVAEGRSRGFLSALLSGKASVNSLSSIIVMTSNNAERLQAEARLKFSRYKNRQKFFENTGSSTLAIVDPLEESVRIYQEGIDEVSVTTFDQISSNADAARPQNITQALDSYRQGKAVSF